MKRRKLQIGWLPFCQIVIAAALLGYGMSAMPPESQLAKAPEHPKLIKKVVPKPKPLPPPYTFPAGGRQLLPAYRLVALYGTPGAPVLGALGQQPPPAAIARVKALAAEYQPLTAQHVLPTFEIIATVASAFPTANGDYSREVDPAVIKEWVEAARQNGVYVVLDLQPGRRDFLSQAKLYESILKQPNVGLALDPEWRLGQNQLPLRQIGSVGITEVNQTAAWLANLTKENKLPQKLFLLHEFRDSMLPQRQALDTSHPELAYIIQMDGQGAQDLKAETWRTITAAPPANTVFGWKNFYQKDPVVLTPAQTMAIKPMPWYVSYQ